jgi:hypothetical protein
MRLLTNKPETTLRPLSLLALQGSTEYPIQPDQLWPLLNPKHQQEVFQTLVQVCCRLVAQAATPGEVCDDSS